MAILFGSQELQLPEASRRDLQSEPSAQHSIHFDTKVEAQLRAILSRALSDTVLQEFSSAEDIVRVLDGVLKTGERHSESAASGAELNARAAKGVFDDNPTR